MLHYCPYLTPLPLDLENQTPEVKWPPVECQTCGKESLNAYKVTLGPSVRKGDDSTRSEVRVCDECVRCCRKTAIRVCVHASLEGSPDALCQWFHKCQTTTESKPLCECSEEGAKKCDFCRLADCLTLFHEKLQPVVEEEPDTSSVLEVAGSPLFLACCRSLPEEVSKTAELYERLIPEDSLTGDKKPSCVICASDGPTLFKFENNAVACQMCVIAYKAAITLLEKQQGSQPDIGHLAGLIALPCSSDHSASPLWATCPGCHARRCLRLLHPLEPSLSLPQWLKRRARLVFFESTEDAGVPTLNDLDPGVTVEKVSSPRRSLLYVVKVIMCLHYRLFNRCRKSAGVPFATTFFGSAPATLLMPRPRRPVPSRVPSVLNPRRGRKRRKMQRHQIATAASPVLPRRWAFYAIQNLTKRWLWIHLLR